MNLGLATLIYIFFACISYNLQWFYLSGSFAYIDLLLPILLLLTISKRFRKPDTFTLLLALLALLSCASSLNSVLQTTPGHVNAGYLIRSLYFVGLYLLIVNSSVSTDQILKAIALSLMFSLLLCFYVWSTSPRYFGYSALPMLHVVDSPTGIVVNRNESGLTAALLFSIALYSFAFKQLFSRAISTILLLVSGATVALSFSKGAWILALLALSIISIYRLSAFKIMATCSALVFAIPFVPWQNFAFLSAVLFRFSASGQTNAFRIQYVIDAFTIGSENMALGIGPGNYQQYTAANGYTVSIDPHNAYFQTFAELGIFAFLIVLFFFSFSVLQSYRYSKNSRDFIVIFVLFVVLAADGFQSGLSLTMKILYILAAILMREGLNARVKD